MNKKIIFTLALVASLSACTDDYKDWAEPQSIPQPTTITFGDGSVAGVGTVNLNNLAEGQTTVQVVSITAPTATDASYQPSYLLNIGGNYYNLDNEGRMNASDLQAYLAANFGRNPNYTRTIDATVEMWVGNGTTMVKRATSGVFQINAIAQAPVIEEAYYVTGNINGWDNTDTTYELTNNGGDVYANPVFTCNIPAEVVSGDLEFKLTPKSGVGGDWSKCLTASDTEGRFDTDNAGGNFVVKNVPGAKFYTLSFDMLDQTYTVSTLSFDPFVYFIGATDGWSKPEQKLASQGEGLYTGYLYIADPNGWGIAFKFQKIPGDWDSQLNVDSMTGGLSGEVFDNGNGDRNFVVGSEGVYYVELDLANNTLKATLVNTMGIIGDFNGWGGDVVMTWNPADYCYEVTNAPVTANGWKFRINSDWGINLGSNDTVEPSTILNDLVGNGKNIGVAGSTIKLYPTRRDSDNIYCTVE